MNIIENKYSSYRLHEESYFNENGVKISSIYRYNESGILLSKITITGNYDDVIDKEKYFYDNKELLICSEDNKYLRNYEYNDFGRLNKLVIENKNNNEKNEYITYEYSEVNNIVEKTKQNIFTYEGIQKYELRFKYDNNGKRIATLKNNELFGFRTYDHNGLIKEYNMVTGDTIYFSWENKFIKYDWDAYFGF